MPVRNFYVKTYNIVLTILNVNENKFQHKIIIALIYSKDNT